MTTQTCKTDEAAVACDSYVFMHMVTQTNTLSWIFKRIFPVSTC